MYETGEYVFRMGESLDRVMILLKGKAAVVHEDFWGKKEELYCIREGEVFGETYSCARTPVLPVRIRNSEGGCAGSQRPLDPYREGTTP